MNPIRHLQIILRQCRKRAIRKILAHRIQYLNPTLSSDYTAIWDYSYRDPDSIELGANVRVAQFASIVVYKRTMFSSVEGKLIVGDNSVIEVGANIRAAGGVISIGSYSVVAQYSVLVAANHRTVLGEKFFFRPWDESRTGIVIGDNVWIAAGCVILPGTTIGNNVVVAAGSVVNKDIPDNEIWGGVPAKKLKDLPSADAA